MRFCASSRFQGISVVTHNDILDMVKADRERKHFIVHGQYTMTSPERHSLCEETDLEELSALCQANLSYYIVQISGNGGHSVPGVDSEAMAAEAYTGSALLYHATRSSLYMSILAHGLRQGGVQHNQRREVFFATRQPHSREEISRTRHGSDCIVVIDPDVARQAGATFYVSNRTDTITSHLSV
jgi:RNA:NAD 2'-phosphotransferase (TPT1/KptA family)